MEHSVARQEIVTCSSPGPWPHPTPPPHTQCRLYLVFKMDTPSSTAIVLLVLHRMLHPDPPVYSSISFLEVCEKQLCCTKMASQGTLNLKLKYYTVNRNLKCGGLVSLSFDRPLQTAEEEAPVFQSHFWTRFIGCCFPGPLSFLGDNGAIWDGAPCFNLTYWSFLHF